MRKTRVFTSGNSQAVRIPADFHLEGNEVEILKRKHEIILREIPANLSKAFILLTKFSDDFFVDERKDTKPQKREFF
jgi:antitoxin VapB